MIEVCLPQRVWLHVQHYTACLAPMDGQGLMPFATAFSVCVLTCIVMRTDLLRSPDSAAALCTGYKCTGPHVPCQ